MLWILKILVKVGHMYSLTPFNSIRNHTLFLVFLCLFSFSQLESTHSFSLAYLQQLQQSFSPKISKVSYGSSKNQLGSAPYILFLHSILLEVILNITSLIDMSCFSTTNAFFSPIILFLFPQLESTHTFRPIKILKMKAY